MGGGTFAVTNLQVLEPAPAEAPTTIIPVGGEFSLTVEFTGTGSVWNNLKNMGVGYEVAYFVEGIGANAAERDLGVKAGNLVAATNVYSGADTTLAVPAANNNLPVGIYRVGCTVTLPTFPGTTGFVEDLIIQIYTP